MAYQDRRRYVPDGWYEAVYAPTGDATSALLLDGVAGGVWDFEEHKKTLIVKVALFDEAGQPLWDALAAQAVRLADAAGFASLALVRCPPPASLNRGSQNLFKSPLKDVQGERIFTRQERVAEICQDRHARLARQSNCRAT